MLRTRTENESLVTLSPLSFVEGNSLHWRQRWASWVGMQRWVLECWNGDG